MRINSHVRLSGFVIKGPEKTRAEIKLIFHDEVFIFTSENKCLETRKGIKNQA